MNGTEEVAKRLYEACLSGSVETLKALIGKDPLILDRASSTECFSSDTPLHVAALRGHLEFTNALLSRKPTLAAELDSRRCTPLHLASTEGHFKIVHELLRVNPDICITRDQDGRTPFHLAVMKGRVEVIYELLGVKPYSVHDKLGRGETVLHLSVKYNRLEALKTLVEYLLSNDMESLLNSIDDDGNTVLHLAAALKQLDTVEYLLGIESVKDHANDKNHNGFTALDVVEHCPNRDLKTMEIREFLLEAGVHRSVPKSPPDNPPPPRPPQHCCKAVVKLMLCIAWFWNKYIKLDRLWLKEVRGHLITAATLTGTMAYQSILSPPGGFWQETKERQNAASLAHSPSPSFSSLTLAEEQTAGQAIMDTADDSYGAYLFLNTIVLGASLSTIMLAMTGFPMENKFLTWLLVFTVYITISCMGAAYVIAITLVSPKQTPPDVLYGLLLAGMGVCAFVMTLHSCRFLVWLGNKLVKLVQECYKCCKPTRRATPNSKDNQTGSHKCAGSFC
ncbi:ankyrin repeat-containing protein At5g02620-like isoform X1 [Rhododendron vialii]|uniref:ankyrin repeat-containing protein At5g02620-like isoform X1 n=1 Tax=Rhododendron vialii TaxID=182163 RepID=UPI0026601028|nr:ankyrin repeat-containing protein At5g02620-like isoform X1 [Rhododendron vialii]